MTIYDRHKEFLRTIAGGGDGKAYPFERSPLAYVLAPNVVWVNGDRGRPQERMRWAIEDAIEEHALDNDITIIFVPLPALLAAGVDFRTIQPLEVRADEWTYEYRTSATPPDDMSAQASYETAVQVLIGNSWVQKPTVSRIWADWADDEHIFLQDDPESVGWVLRDGNRQMVRFYDGMYHWHDARHWLGDSVFTASGQGEPPRYFISSFDRQETNPLYFLSQLPYPVSTIDEAIESLAPESVKTARDMGRDVKRQGDMFAIPTGVDTRQLRAMGAQFKRRKVYPQGIPRGRSMRRWVDAAPLYGTAHTATEVATLPDGRQYARGQIYHDPAVIGETRPPDHRRRKLGRQWHLIARNTVPVRG